MLYLNKYIRPSDVYKQIKLSSVDKSTRQCVNILDDHQSSVNKQTRRSMLNKID